jgi:hypothetical protein
MGGTATGAVPVMQGPPQGTAQQRLVHVGGARPVARALRAAGVCRSASLCAANRAARRGSTEVGTSQESSTSSVR